MKLTLFKGFVCFIFFCIPNFTILAQQSIIIQPGPNEGKDAKVWSLQPNTNFANHPLIKANAWTWGGEFGIERTYIEFDLSVIPPNADISAAYLSLYYHYLPDNPEQTHSGDNWTTLKRVVSQWNENTITWANQPGVTELNKVILYPTTGPQVDFIDIEVTQLVIDMLNSPQNSFGFQLKIQNEQTYRRVGLSTSDHPVPSRWPKLEIIFACSIDLGNDTIICNGDTLSLNAGTGYTQYLWSNGSGDSSIVVTSSGEYWVTVFDGYGCEASDTINVIFFMDTINQHPLGPDRTLCSGEVLLLNAGEGLDNYLWQDGSTESTLLVQYAGIYWVIASNFCGTVLDSVFIDYYPEINLELGNDTLICDGHGILLDAGWGYSTYHWSDGTFTYQNFVTIPGIYVVEVWDINNCYATDDIYIDFHYPNLDLGNDTAICPGSSILINAGDSYEYYVWNDSLLFGLPVFIAETPGTYWVEIIDSVQNVGCHATDTIVIGQYPIPSTPELADEYWICPGDTLILNAGVGSDFYYSWNGGNYDSLFTVTQQGEFKVWIYNVCDTIEKKVDIFAFPKPDVTILIDSSNSTGSYFTLYINGDYESILWSTGSEELLIQAINTGLYSVQVMNEFGCSSSDTLFLELVVCDFFVPIVFTPNGDEKNPVFQIDYHYINDFQIVIFDRWGNRILESDDPYFNWDGTFQGKNCADGVYYWIIQYNCMGFAGHNFIKKGSVTLLR
jgi:gliding motility-associated-like protein